MKNSLYQFDRGFLKNYNLICVIDEAGRGELAGPVCIAAIILPSQIENDEIKDSKKLTEQKREKLYKYLTKNAKSYRIELIHNEMIDKINILNATLLGMLKAHNSLNIRPDVVLVDGNRKPKIDNNIITIVKGDSKSQSIAAASILAKVYRDRFMKKISNHFPNYNFSKHKGYATKEHLNELSNNPYISIHRKTFAPIKHQIKKNLFSYKKKEL